MKYSPKSKTKKETTNAAMIAMTISLLLLIVIPYSVRRIVGLELSLCCAMWLYRCDVNLIQLSAIWFRSNPSCIRSRYHRHDFSSVRQVLALHVLQVLAVARFRSCRSRPDTNRKS